VFLINIASTCNCNPQQFYLNCGHTVISFPKNFPWSYNIYSTNVLKNLIELTSMFNKIFSGNQGAANQ
jgi:hypothetical protein